MKDAYLQEADAFGVRRRAWFEQEPNNAHLVSEQHYNNLVDTFAVLYGSAAHRNWDVFYSIVKNIASWPEARRKEYLEKLPKE